MPRRAMSSVKEVSSDSDCSTRSTRGATKVPEPCRCTSRRASTSACTALRTVTRLRPVSWRHVALRRQALAGPQRARLDRRGDPRLELQIERPAPRRRRNASAAKSALIRGRRAMASAPSSPLPSGARISARVAPGQPRRRRAARARRESRSAAARRPAAGRGCGRPPPRPRRGWRAPAGSPAAAASQHPRHHRARSPPAPRAGRSRGSPPARPPPPAAPRAAGVVARMPSWASSAVLVERAADARAAALVAEQEPPAADHPHRAAALHP